MDRILQANCIKQSSTHLVAITAVLATIATIIVVMSFTMDDNPFEEQQTLWIILSIVIWSFVPFILHLKKHVLEIALDGDENQHLSISKNGKVIITLSAPFTTESVYMRVAAGGSSTLKVKELYLIFKEGNEVKLTLRHSLGAAYNAPENFREIPLGSVQSANEFSCSSIERIEGLVNYKKIQQ